MNLLHLWNRWECKRDKRVKFVTLLNMWDCWMRCEWEIRLYNWICDPVEYVGVLNEIWMWNR